MAINTLEFQFNVCNYHSYGEFAFHFTKSYNQKYKASKIQLNDNSFNINIV